ncbi:MAG: 3'-5' exonuclease [Gammaproteobacteria bacterium]
MVRCLVFDIETVPDTALGSQLLGFKGISDEDVAKAMAFNQMQEKGTDFLPLYQHRVVAISAAWRSAEGFKVWSVGSEESDEKEIVQRFFEGIDRYSPELVSWNGAGFDLPVLHYRALLHGIRSPRYWETGDEDRSFRYNNYLSRFHWRHIDLMDVLSGFQNRARAPLDAIATMLGFPGKMGMAGDNVWDSYRKGEIRKIRDYCETDVLNTYLVYLRFQFMRGQLDEAGLDKEYALVRQVLEESGEQHLQEFLQAWAA